MDTSIGSVIGTSIVILFGGAIAFFVPRMIKREDSDHGAGDLPVGLWIRILGLIVMAVGILQVVLMIAF